MRNFSQNCLRGMILVAKTANFIRLYSMGRCFRMRWRSPSARSYVATPFGFAICYPRNKLTKYAGDRHAQTAIDDVDGDDSGGGVLPLDPAPAQFDLDYGLRAFCGRIFFRQAVGVSGSAGSTPSERPRSWRLSAYGNRLCEFCADRVHRSLASTAPFGAQYCRGG